MVNILQMRLVSIQVISKFRQLRQYVAFKYHLMMKCVWACFTGLLHLGLHVVSLCCSLQVGWQ